ncbi:cytochrome P450 [Xylariales sp. PMI_506]|nr:cytochrome P450 [Xylariales sp. PMI_506]
MADSLVAAAAKHPLAQWPYATGVAIFIGFSLLYWIYQRALPKPIPGIPYNERAVRSPFGDIGGLRQAVREGMQARAWVGKQAAMHNSPIAQIFMAPFAAPMVIVSDFHEAQDILLRRGKEFDRGQRSVDALGGVIPYHHISMKTSDPQFKANKELVKDLMTPQFLNTVSAPEIHSNALKFIELWKSKARVANGRPFSASEDIHTVTFDIIKLVALGEGHSSSMTELNRKAVEAGDYGDQESKSKDEPFLFPAPLYHEDMVNHGYQQDAIGEAVTKASPSLFHKVNNLRPYMRRSYAAKMKLLDEQVALAVKRLEAGEPVRSALDHMIQREINGAKKAGRPPVFKTPSMYDEVYGYLGAGHDTTSTGFQWAMKQLSMEPAAQRKLRAALRAAWPDAHREKRQPTVLEVTKTNIPYLDAMVEESLRLWSPLPATTREATVDTTLLGHRIPKGTTIYLNLDGPSITTPAYPIDDSLRSESYRAHKESRSAWEEDPTRFVPERWLKKDEGGQEVYDAQAGPFLSFGAGVRGCFGRRLAYLEFRTLLALAIWNFELGELPDELNSFDCRHLLTRKPVKCYVRVSEAK